MRHRATKSAIPRCSNRSRERSWSRAGRRSGECRVNWSREIGMRFIRPTRRVWRCGALASCISALAGIVPANAAGDSPQPSAATATTPDTRSAAIPAPPTGLTVSSTTTGSVTLAWNASTGAPQYNVYRNGTEVGSSASTSYTDDGLSPGTTYTYAVTAVSTTYVYTPAAVNSSGESAKSPTVKALTRPQAVTAPLILDYAEGRITLPQFRQLGPEYGRYRLVTLYLCGSTWTTSSTCGSLDAGRARWSRDAMRSDRQD